MNIKIKGKFQRIIYSSNNFFVYVFKMFNDELSKVGELELASNAKSFNVIFAQGDIDISLDYEIEIRKEVRPNSKYKISYHLVNKEIIIPNEKEGCIRFLSSSLFKGISTKTAEKLVNNIDIDFIKDINSYEDKIVSLIGSKKFSIIRDVLENNKDYNEIYQIFTSENFSIPILNYIRDNSNKSIKEFLHENVFDLIDLADDISFNFFELDKIAKHFYSHYSEEISDEYLILYQIFNLEFQGSTVNSLEKIYNSVSQYKKIDLNIFKERMILLAKKEKIMIWDKKEITSKRVYEKEEYICKKILMLQKNNIDHKISHDELILENADEVQKQSVFNSLNNPLSIITGGPGTGKTLLINLLLKNFSKLGIEKIELLAPTGKAATQISARTEKAAKTFHSFLKWNGKSFDVNEKNYSNIEVIIIDEFSMINIDLFYSLLKACPRLKQLILVGDKDQLPSIGSGYLLNDLIESKKIITNVLKKIYRQNEGSLIAKNSTKIRDGIFPDFDDNESVLLDYKHSYDIYNWLLKDFDQTINRNPNINDYQILIPMYEGDLGINKINLLLQEHINQNKYPLFTLNNKRYFRNDKVIQLENDNTKNIFNGEIGRITSVEIENDDIKEIIIEFNNKRISYSKSEFQTNISLAYAISIHKFQGSECDKVVLIFNQEHRSMFSKKLFYTAYTRAKMKVIIFSTPSIISECINFDKDSFRKGNILRLLN